MSFYFTTSSHFLQEKEDRIAIVGQQSAISGLAISCQQDREHGKIRRNIQAKTLASTDQQSAISRQPRRGGICVEICSDGYLEPRKGDISVNVSIHA